MALKVSMKKYLALNGKWQFVPVLKVNDKPRPEAVLIDGQAVKGTTGTFYLDYRDENGKRIQRPVGTSPREALDEWNKQKAIHDGTIEPPEEDPTDIPANRVSIESAAKTYLAEVKGTKSAGTHEAYSTDLEWFRTRIRRRFVGQVTRADIMEVFGKGRDEGLAQASINRRITVGLMALRNAGASLQLKKGDWPKVPEVEVAIYDDDEIKAFMAACNTEERLIFKAFLLTGFRNREIATLTWDSVDFRANTIGVKRRPAYEFTPKNHECRTVPVPASFIAELKEWRKKSKGALVFPTPPHPKRPNYGGDQPNAHLLELCKEVGLRAGLNCGSCETKKGRCATRPCCAGFFLHKWRHTYATKLLQSGVDIRSLQLLLGHKNLSTTERYLKSLRIGDLSAKIENSKLAALVA
jgi:integrase